MATSEARADLTRSAVSRYLQLATLFRRRIQSGHWPLGVQIPTIDELAAECGVARATIRHALSTLEAEGLVERFRAKGTFVRKRPQDRLWCEVETNWAGLLSARQGAVIEVLSHDVGQVPPVRPHPIGDLADSYRRLRRRHWQQGEPFLLTEVFLDEKLSKDMT